MPDIVSFSGHETFPFRHGWLKKGVDAVSRDPAFFAQDRAMVELGVGKNMVVSIRHWSLAARLIQEALAGQRSRLVPTNYGIQLFSNDGFDPYLEDLGTLWLIHWFIATNSEIATTWYWMFSNWNGLEFTKDRILFEIQAWLQKHGHKVVSENSLKRDIDCFVRTYVHSRLMKSTIVEDTLDCPLVDLRLIVELEDGRTFLFQRGPQSSLPDEVFAFALIEFWRTSASGANSMAFEKIAYDPGSPGRIFKLDEDSLASRLEGLEALTRGNLSYDETVGLRQIYRRHHIDGVSLLRKYYRRTTRILRPPM